jgi:hypothetical protein
LLMFPTNWKWMRWVARKRCAAEIFIFYAAFSAVHFPGKFSASENPNQTMFCKHIFKASTLCCYDTNRRATAEAPPEHTRQTSFHVNGDLDIAASVEVNRSESDFRVHKTFIFNKVACCENLSTSWKIDYVTEFSCLRVSL